MKREENKEKQTFILLKTDTREAQSKITLQQKKKKYFLANQLKLIANSLQLTINYLI